MPTPLCSWQYGSELSPDSDLHGIHTDSTAQASILKKTVEQGRTRPGQGRPRPEQRCWSDAAVEQSPETLGPHSRHPAGLSLHLQDLKMTLEQTRLQKCVAAQEESIARVTDQSRGLILGFSPLAEQSSYLGSSKNYSYPRLPAQIN